MIDWPIRSINRFNSLYHFQYFYSIIINWLFNHLINQNLYLCLWAWDSSPWRPENTKINFNPSVKDRAGHFRDFFIFSIIKNHFFALFIKLITYFYTLLDKKCKKSFLISEKIKKYRKCPALVRMHFFNIQKHNQFCKLNPLMPNR